MASVDGRPALAEFLLARFDEEEAMAEEAERNPQRPSGPHYVTGIGRVLVIGREYLLSECEAKRQIVQATTWDIESHEFESSADYAHAARQQAVILQALALPYADHPDWREEWAV